MTEEQFYDLQPFAIFGVSSQGKGFGTGAYKELVKVDVRVYAVNPKGGMINGQPIYEKLTDIPERPRAAVILTKEEGARSAIEECSRFDIECVWLQGGSDTEKMRKLCHELEIAYFTGSCILMRKGKFPHNIHRVLNRLFSKKSA